MKKLLAYLGVLLCLVFAVWGCGADIVLTENEAAVEQQVVEDEVEQQQIVGDDTADVSEIVDEEIAEESETVVEDTVEVSVIKDGSYTSPEDVALYIYTYGTLPENFITKREAEALGWVSKEGNLHEVAPGMSIGGDRFGNYEQSLPDGNYKECDVNYEGGYRGDERLVYSDEGAIYYTDDHYETFTQLY